MRWIALLLVAVAPIAVVVSMAPLLDGRASWLGAMFGTGRYRCPGHR